jgi:hypothetical protein
MTDVVEAGTEKRGRGAPPGPRGPRVWKPKATQREKIMGASLQEAIKAETGHDVDLETIRAVRFTLPKWLKSDEFKEKKNNLSQFLEQQKLIDKKNKALKALAEVQAAGLDIDGLDNLGFDSDDDSDDDEDEDDDYDESDELEDEDEDSEDVFAEAGGTVRRANF